MKTLKESIRKRIQKVRRNVEASAANNHGMVGQQALNDMLYDAIQESSPFIAGKIGANELLVSLWHLEWRLSTHLWMKFSWETTKLTDIGAGIFPRNPENFHEYAKAYLAALGEVNYLGMWHNEGETRLSSTFATNAKIGHWWGLRPFLINSNPWTRALAGKKVLVVTPFVNTISQQIGKIDLIWKNYEEKHGQALIPESTSFETVKFPYAFDTQVQKKYDSWQNVMKFITDEIESKDFDVTVLGCGGYSLPLVAKIKKMGRSAIHLGGDTQLLFGIKGNRWKTLAWFRELMNDYWISPLDEDKPEKEAMKNCEQASYW